MFPSALAGPSQGGRVVRCGVVYRPASAASRVMVSRGVVVLLSGLTLVRDDVGESDPAVPSHRRVLEGDSNGLQELDQSGAADAEEVRGLWVVSSWSTGATAIARPHDMAWTISMSMRYAFIGRPMV